jgi:hypothetical protein
MRYRKIDPRIWNDEKFRTLTDDGRLSFLFILTHPHMTARGAMRATIAGLAAEIGWVEERFRVAISHAIKLEMLQVNETACYFGATNFLKYNEPEGPNSVIKAWPASLELIPECSERRALIRRITAYLNGTSDKFRNVIGSGFIDAMSRASRIQEQEHDKEQELNQEQEQRQQHDDAAGVEPGSTDSHFAPSVVRTPAKLMIISRFENFWLAYPKRVSKHEAARAWERLGVDEDTELFDKIMSGLAEHKRSAAWLKDGGQYIPHPSTWLNGRRWTDEMPSAATTVSGPVAGALAAMQEILERDQARLPRDSAGEAE